jgi:hypothetical protein
MKIMFLRWDAIRVVIKRCRNVIRIIVKYVWNAIYVKKGFWEAIHVQRNIDAKRYSRYR